MNEIYKRYSALQASLQSPLGRYLLKRETEAIEELLERYRGKKILVLNTLDGIELSPPSVFQTCWWVCPSSTHNPSKVSLRARFDALPFDSASFDIVILQHALEFSRTPTQVLKEAARVTTHGGHLFVFGFNPLSSHGLVSAVLGGVRHESFWRRKALFLYRVKDWLRFLDFNPLESINLGHCLPVSNLRYLSVMSTLHRLLTRINMPFSPIYCIVSRKDELGFTMTKPGWKRVVLESAMPVTSPAQSASNSAKVIKIQDYK